MNPRESIEYHKRKFKYSLAGNAANATFVFDLQQPPNEFAFSDRYSQCLIKINHAYLSNRGDAVNHGLDAVFIDAAGALEVMTGGCLLLTDVRTNNSNVLSENIGGGVGGGFQLVKSGIHCVLHNMRGSVGVQGNFAGQPVDAASEVIVGKAAAGAGLQGSNQNLHRVMMWEYKDDRPIEDAGVLCANPFGRKMEVRLFSTDSGEQVALTSAANFGVAASNGTSLNIEIEILMLPNPTPEDK